MKKVIHFTISIGILIFYSCSGSDLKNMVPPACSTAQVPQQVTLDWTSAAPSYYELDGTNTQVPCTSEPFYDQSTGELSSPPYATNYNYLTQASAIPSSALIPSDPNSSIPVYANGAKQNELGIVESNTNYLCQITSWSNEMGQDNCTYNGNTSTGPVLTVLWLTVGAVESVPMYEFNTQSAAGVNTYLANHIVADYFDVFDLCSTVTERPYFSGAADVQIPVGANANTMPVTIPMISQDPVLQ